MTMGIFGTWQPRYAEAGIAVFPVDGAAKKPVVGNYLRAGLPASAAWARKFPEADALGVACGKRNGLTVLDVDTRDERVLADAMSLFGPSPVVIRTGSGKWHAWYRFNGESRQIRSAMPGQPVDVLGNGYAVAPPSMGANGHYEFVQGSLADLAMLPVMRCLAADPPPAGVPPPGVDTVPVGERNKALWRACMAHARSCKSLDEVIAFGRSINLATLASPLPDDEVIRSASSAWAKTTGGTNWFGEGERVTLTHDDLHRLLPLGPDAVSLLLKLRLHHWGRDFAVANAMAETMPDGHWTTKRFAAARKRLLDAGELIEVRPASMKYGPALYRFAAKTPTRGSRGEEGEGC